MAWNTTGKVHHDGIANEHFVANFLTETNRYGEIVHTRGGTKHKEDAYTESGRKISIKEKKNISTGSFDWVNTTVINSMFGDHFDSFRAKINDLRSNASIEERKSIKEDIRKEDEELCASAFEKVDLESLRDFISNAITHGIDDVVVNDQNTSTLYFFDPKNHPIVEMCNNEDVTISFKSGRGKKSKKIVFIKDGVEYDFGLRMNIKQNNGIGALLGISKSNKNSYVKVTLQQDAVHKIVKEHIKSEVVKY